MSILSDPISDHIKIFPKQKLRLERAGFKTAEDLLRHFPVHYEEFKEPKTIANLAEGDEAVVTGRVIKSSAKKGWKSKINIAETTINDGTGSLNITWFNQPYMAKILNPEKIYSFSGKVSTRKGKFYMANPDYEESTGAIKILSHDEEEKTLIPHYPSVRGIQSKWFQFAIKKIVEKLKGTDIKDPIPSNILKKYNLPSLKTSFLWLHEAQSKKMSEAARKRFSFEEILGIQLSRQKIRIRRESLQAPKIETKKTEIANFKEKLPFTLTGAQEKAVKNILEDMLQSKPMSRLLEGDVGSGKTAVAAIASYAVFQNGMQSAYMAPTEVLAQQHFAEFIERFGQQHTKIGLITSSECLKYPSKVNPGEATHISKSQLLKWVASGEISILIGTHALIQDKVKFRNLALTIVDEQHRFGVNQRAKLAQKFPSTGSGQVVPHLLSMTATPIPRTLALTIYGDLDLTLIDEMPPGRKQVQTIVVPPAQRTRAYEQMRAEIAGGRQAYVVCPRIEENSKSTSPASLDMKSVKAEHKKLSEEIFPEFSVAMLHGKMLSKVKEKTMQEFKKGEHHVLVATSVIEVGVNVPNATMILIEGAERFGLAQLHQLRGRVLRSIHQPHCFIFTESSSQKTLERLNALQTAKNGFELAEYDLKFRGAGELSGKKQWGITDVGMEALRNIKMVEAARNEAQTLLKKDFDLSAYPLLRELVPKFESLHME